MTDGVPRLMDVPAQYHRRVRVTVVYIYAIHVGQGEKTHATKPPAYLPSSSRGVVSRTTMAIPPIKPTPPHMVLMMSAKTGPSV